MDKTSAVLYDYSKACGLLSKAFVKDRASLLFEQKSLSELWTLLFKTPAPLMPETLLAQEIEKKAFSEFIKQYEYFLKQYDNPPEILVNQFRRYEVENLKEILDALCSGEKELPQLIDLHGYSVLNVQTWPDIAKITEGTIYSWVNKIPDIHQQQQVEFRLDLQLIQETWKTVQACKGESKAAQEKLFLDEFKIKNVIWALRLSMYYGMSREDVIKNLFYVENEPSKTDPVAGSAIRVLDFDVNKYSDWENWEFKNYLNPVEAGLVWQVSPSWIERISMADRQRKAYAVFHSYPLEDVALAAWFKIKSYELNCIRTAVESIRLNVDSNEALKVAGIVSSDKAGV